MQLKSSKFLKMLRQDPAHMEGLLKKLQTWLLHVRWRKAQYGVFACIKCMFLVQKFPIKNYFLQMPQLNQLAVKNKILWRAAQLIKIQSAQRGYLTRKIYRPRLLHSFNNHFKKRHIKRECCCSFQ